MTFLGFSGLVNFLTSILLGTFVLFKNPASVKNRSYFYLNSSVALYSFGYFVWQLCTRETTALFWFKILSVGIILINVTYLHFVFAFVEILKRKRRELLIYYVINIVFIFLAINSFLYTGVESRYNLGFWPIPTNLFHVYLAFWLWQCLYGFSWLLKGLRTTKGVKREQIKYFTIAAVLGFAGGATNWPMWYRIHLPPYPNITISVYIALVTYAIVRYRLMDIRVVITRGGIFVFVYTLFLGLPFLLGIKTGHWVGAMVLMGVFASCGPFVYSYLRQRSEEVILREERRYQKALKEFASTLIFIKDVEELTRKVVTRVMDSLNVKFCAIYLRNDKNFCLAYFESKDSLELPKEVGVDSEFILGLRQAKGPLLGEELASWGGRDLGLVVPLLLNQKLFGMILLSEKEKGFFTESDLDVFAILSGQISLALSEIYYLEEYQKVLREKYEVMIEKERLESAFQISEAFRHELGNIINIISLSLANLIFTEKYQPTREDIEETAFSIRRSVKRARAIFDAINDYNNNNQSEFRLVKLDNLLRERIARYRKDILEKGINLEVNLEDDIEVLGNDNLGDALEYILAGGIRAISERLPAKKAIYVNLKRDEGVAHLEISDTGGDVTADTLYKGVGIERGKEGGIFYFIARRIIFDHKGSFKIVSFNEGEGTTFIIELPLGKRR